MASTYSTLKIELIGTGEQAGLWGTTTNTNLGTALEEAIVGSADVSFSSADVTLTLTDTNASQSARHVRLNLTGTSGGARNLILGSGCQIDKPYLINNGLADTVTVKNTTGTGIAVPAGKTMWVFNNGTNVVDAVTHLSSLTLTTALPVASGGTGGTTESAARTGLGATTVGSNFFTLTNPSAIRFPRINADNTVSALTDSDFRTAIGAGTGAGTVTSVATGTGLTGGTITSSGTVSVATNGITDALLRQSAGLSLVGRSANSTGNVADITAAADHNVLRRSGTTIGFGAISLNQSGAVTGTLAAGNGGTGNAFFTVSGPASSIKTYTFPNENMSVGYLNIPAVADKTTSYSLTTGDIGKVVGVGSGGSITIPNSTFAAGDAVLIFNNTAGDITITCTITTAYIAGTDADVASVTLATRGVCNILFLSGTACVLTGNIA